MPNPPQITPTELLDILRPHVQFRREAQFAWKSIVSSWAEIPLLRALWSASSINFQATDRVRDLAGGGFHLTSNNTPLWGYQSATLIPVGQFAASSSQYISRTDAGGLGIDWADIIGNEGHIISAQRGLTLGGWYLFETKAPTTSESLISKWNNTTNHRSYLIARMSGTTNSRFYISTNGVATVSVTGPALPADETWYFVVGRFDPSTALDIFVNPAYPSDYTQNAAGIPATIYNSNASLVIMSRASLSWYCSGYWSIGFLSAGYLSDSIIWQLFEQSRTMFNV